MAEKSGRIKGVASTGWFWSSARVLLCCPRLSSAAHQLFRRLTRPARANLVTGTLADLPRSRAELLAENALLRQKLSVRALRRRTKTPRLTWRDDLSLVILARWVPNSKQVLQIIQPDTLAPRGLSAILQAVVVKANATQPRRLASDTIALIKRMACENPLWGAERMRGEQLKLNIKVAKRTIQKYMQAERSKTPYGQCWATFL